MADAPVVHISPMGNLGNRVIQYLAARALAERVGAVRFSAVDLRPFDVVHRPIPGDFRTEIVTGHAIELDLLADALRSGTIERVDIRTYAQRVANFLPPDAYRPALSLPDIACETAGEDELLCNIRQGDVLDGHHPDYVLIPIAFYRDLVEETGLRPVFMGQLEESPYLQDLRCAFPRARFLPSEGVAVDFERIRRARNIVPSISTFSWLAAWLSEADRVFLPVLGLLNPAQNRGVDLLPLDDARYRFYHFPIHYGVAVAQYAEAHAAIRRLWRYVPPARLRMLVAAPSRGRDKGLYLDAFDEAYYRAVNPDIAHAVAEGHLPSGRHHFETTGFDEGRAAFALDRGWYCRNYPIAALEIAQGEFADADQHWLEIGRERGYRRGPQEGGRTAGACGRIGSRDGFQAEDSLI